jgi:SAM-dependent methyltransferase
MFWGTFFRAFFSTTFRQGGNAMASDDRLISGQFPLSAKYNPDWLLAGASGGSNALWLAEWLVSAMDLQPGMRVLDLGCGRAASSIFLWREFGVQVWATDLWFSASENLQRIRDAGAAEAVFPLHAEARSLPFAAEFFDAIVSIASFPYYGTDDHYLNYLARFVKPGGQVGIAGEGFMREIDGPVPEHLLGWWTPELWCLHSPDWWRRHWQQTGIVDVSLADTMPDGWRHWLDWMQAIAPENEPEIKALQADQGECLGYLRLVGRRADVELEESVTSIPAQYEKKPLLRAAPLAGPSERGEESPH